MKGNKLITGLSLGAIFTVLLGGTLIGCVPEIKTKVADSIVDSSTIYQNTLKDSKDKSKQIDDLTSQLSIKQSEYDALSLKLKGVQDNLSTCTSKIHSIFTSCNISLAVSASATDDDNVKVAKAELTAIDSYISSLVTEINDLKVEINTLEQSIANVDTLIDDIYQAIPKGNTVVIVGQDTTEYKISCIASYVATLQTDSSDIYTKIQNTAKSCGVYYNSMGSSANSVASGRLSMIADNYTAMRNNLQNLQDQVEMQNTTITDLKAQIEALTKERDSLKAQLDEANAKIAELQKQIVTESVINGYKVEIGNIQNTFLIVNSVSRTGTYVCNENHGYSRTYQSLLICDGMYGKYFINNVKATNIENSKVWESQIVNVAQNYEYNEFLSPLTKKFVDIDDVEITDFSSISDQELFDLKDYTFTQYTADEIIALGIPQEKVSEAQKYLFHFEMTFKAQSYEVGKVFHLIGYEDIVVPFDMTWQTFIQGGTITGSDGTISKFTVSPNNILVFTDGSKNLSYDVLDESNNKVVVDLNTNVDFSKIYHLSDTVTSEDITEKIVTKVTNVSPTDAGTQNYEIAKGSTVADLIKLLPTVDGYTFELYGDESFSTKLDSTFELTNSSVEWIKWIKS